MDRLLRVTSGKLLTFITWPWGSGGHTLSGYKTQNDESATGYRFLFLVLYQRVLPLSGAELAARSTFPCITEQTKRLHINMFDT